MRRFLINFTLLVAVLAALFYFSPIGPGMIRGLDSIPVEERTSGEDTADEALPEEEMPVEETPAEEAGTPLESEDEAAEAMTPEADVEVEEDLPPLDDAVDPQAISEDMPTEGSDSEPEAVEDVAIEDEAIEDEAVSEELEEAVDTPSPDETIPTP